MQLIKVNQGQTLLDIAMQYMGDAAFAADIALYNGLGVTSELATGDELEIPELPLNSRQERIVQKFKKEGIVPAGALPQ